MIIANHKPVCIIGYQQSSMTHEFVNEISKTHSPQVMEPQDFLQLSNRQQYQYIVASWIDREQRNQVIGLLDQERLDLITVIHDSVVLGDNPAPIIQPGTFVFAFCHLSIGSKIGKHCIICAYSMIGHYSTLGNGCVVRPGVIVVGKSQIGNNCYLNTRSTVINGAQVCDDVELMGFSALTKNASVPGKYIGTPARLQN